MGLQKFSNNLSVWFLELGLGSCRVGFVFRLNLNGLKTSEPEPDLFNKRVENLNPNHLTLKRVDLNPTRLHKQVKRVGFRLPIYLPTHLIYMTFNTK